MKTAKKQETKQADDPVNSPSHYTQGAIECIDAIREALGVEGYRAFLKGQIFKYLWRAKHKGQEGQDYKKAQWYMNRLVELEAQP